jgi:predicted DNA-binding transcriptional regulator AlpA
MRPVKAIVQEIRSLANAHQKKMRQRQQARNTEAGRVDRGEHMSLDDLSAQRTMVHDAFFALARQLDLVRASTPGDFNGPFDVREDFDQRVTRSQFRRLCGLAAMATYQGEWGGQRGHIVSNLSIAELSPSQMFEDGSVAPRTVAVGMRTKFARFGKAKHRYRLYRPKSLRVLFAWEELVDESSGEFKRLWRLRQKSEPTVTETASAFIFFDCVSAKNPGEKGIVPGERRIGQHESFGARLIAWANEAVTAWIDAGHCKPFGSFQVLRRQYCSGAYYEWRSTKGRALGQLYTWEDFLDRLAFSADTSVERLLSNYLPANPESLFMPEDEDVLPEYRSMEPPRDTFPEPRQLGRDAGLQAAAALVGRSDEPVREVDGIPDAV